MLYRDGLNRYPMEYSLARAKHGESPGAHSAIGLPNQGLVIISEFISSARVMRGALNVNPWRVQEVDTGCTVYIYSEYSLLYKAMLFQIILILFYYILL